MKGSRVLLSLGIGFTAIWLGFFFFYSVALFLPRDIITGDMVMIGVLLQVLSLQLIGMGGTTAAYIYFSDREVEFLRLRRPDVIDAGAMLLGPVALIMSSGFVLMGFTALGFEPSSHEFVGIFDENPEVALYMIPIAILIIGPFEELLFRGVIQSELVDGYGVEIGVLLASVIFAVVHLPAYSSGGGFESAAVSVSALFVLSLILGSLYEWRDNLYVSMIVHGLYNAVLFASFWITYKFGIDPEELAGFVLAIF